MSNIAIRVDSLGKQYRIGTTRDGYRTLRETLTEAFVAPFHRTRKLLQGQLASAAALNETIWALKDVSAEIRQGEIVGIIGRNGAGKSTLLKILSRITEPTEGCAEIHGRVGSLLEVGTGFHPELTGRENIYLNGAILGMKRAEIESKFDDIVEFAEIDKFIDTPVKHYSSGMYVRLAFAVAAHLEPEILLVDEVLAVGDAAFQKKCLGKMEDVAREGRTVLFVSHNMGAVMDLTDRSILLAAGEVVADGLSSQVVGVYLREDNTSLSRDVSKLKRPAWGGAKPRWQITHVRIVSAEDGLIANKPIEVELGYTAHESLQDISVGIGIANMFGTRLISCRSDDVGLRISSRSGESGVIVVRLECPYLAPGSYILQVGAGTGTQYHLDYIADALRFDIGQDLTDSWALKSLNLGVRLPSTWKLE
jgi:lipopolysaccharide transport system ATP-binding protein